jgi:hypothetical protein
MLRHTQRRFASSPAAQSTVAAATQAASPKAAKEGRKKAEPLNVTISATNKLLRPVELPPNSAMLNQRDAFFGYMGHSEPVEVVFSNNRTSGSQ